MQTDERHPLFALKKQSSQVLSLETYDITHLENILCICIKRGNMERMNPQMQKQILVSRLISFIYIVYQNQFPVFLPSSEAP